MGSQSEIASDAAPANVLRDPPPAGDRLAVDPSTALGPTVPQLLSGANLSMVNFESAMTADGSCPDAQPKQYVFYAPPSAVGAFQGAGVTLITEANNHGEDCGPPGLQTALTTRAQTGYTILGIGGNAAQAFTPYTTTIRGSASPSSPPRR